jgi:hypothetical protein
MSVAAAPNSGRGSAKSGPIVIARAIDERLSPAERRTLAEATSLLERLAQPDP